MSAPATKLWRRSGLLAALALVFMQVATVGHALAADHQPGETCQVCIATDRVDDPAAPADITVFTGEAGADTVCDTATVVPGDSHSFSPNARAPPAL